MRQSTLRRILAEAQKVGGMVHAVILHDDDCPERYQRGACTCTPDVVLEELTVESIERGAEGEKNWRRPT